MTWSVLLEAPLRTHDDPGEAEVRLLHALEELGVEAPITGGGFGNTIAARFVLEGEFEAVMGGALAVFSDAITKASIDVDPPVAMEILTIDRLAEAYGIHALL